MRPPAVVAFDPQTGVLAGEQPGPDRVALALEATGLDPAAAIGELFDRSTGDPRGEGSPQPAFLGGGGMSLEQLHTYCATLHQGLIDLAAAVHDLQTSQEWEHLQEVLAAAMRLVEDDLPPVSAWGNAETNG